MLVLANKSFNLCIRSLWLASPVFLGKAAACVCESERAPAIQVWLNNSRTRVSSFRLVRQTHNAGVLLEVKTIIWNFCPCSSIIVGRFSLSVLSFYVNVCALESGGAGTTINPPQQRARPFIRALCWCKIPRIHSARSLSHLLFYLRGIIKSGSADVHNHKGQRASVDQLGWEI